MASKHLATIGQAPLQSFGSPFPPMDVLFVLRSFHTIMRYKAIHVPGAIEGKSGRM